jgi:autotransporter-associated beta strand protein
VTQVNYNQTAGTYVLLQGTLVSTGNGTFGSGGFTVYGGAVDSGNGSTAMFTQNNPQVYLYGDLAFLGSASINMGTGAVTMYGTRQVTVNANTLTVSGAIGQGSSGSGLTKAGAGTLALSAANTYSGPTTVNQGTLLFSGANSWPSSSAVTVNGGGTFSLADGTARSTTVPALTVASGAAFAFDWTGASAMDSLASTAAPVPRQAAAPLSRAARAAHSITPRITWPTPPATRPC